MERKDMSRKTREAEKEEEAEVVIEEERNERERGGVEETNGQRG